MAKYIQEGKNIDYPNNKTGAKDIAYGDIVKISGRIAIANSNIPIDTVGSISLDGVYEINAVTTESFEIGETVYFNEDKVTKTKPSTNVVVAGTVIKAKATATPMAWVRI